MRVPIAARCALGLWALSLCACQGEATLAGTGVNPGAPSLARVGSYELRVWPERVPASLRANFLIGWQEAVRITLELSESRPSAVRAVERGLLLRSFFEDVAERGLEQSAILDAEQAEVVRQNWQLLDQPPAVEAVEVHLPVGFVESNEIALFKMEELRNQAEGALSLDDFVAKIQEAAARVSAKVDARKLPPLSSEGKVVPKSASDDPKFSLEPRLVEAVSQLSSPGELSPIVGTQGGYHLFYAVQLYPAEHLEGSARAQALHSLLGARRSSSAVTETRKKLKSTVVVEKAGNAAALLERIGRND